MSRAAWKGPYVDRKLYSKVTASLKEGSGKHIKTWSRRSTILPEFVGAVIEVHNGKTHIPVFIKEDMVSHKLGEFASTRNYRPKAPKKGGR